MGLLVGPGVDVHADVLPVGRVVPAVQGKELLVGLQPAGHGKAVELALMGEGILGPGLDDDVQALAEQGVALAHVAAVRIDVELERGAFVESAPRSEVDPTPGHVVEQGDVLRHPQRMPVRQHHGCLAHANLLAVGGQVRPIRIGLGGAFM